MNVMKDVNFKPLDASCLNSWPEGTVGYEQEDKAIKTLIDLCDKHGYGRMQQIMQDIHNMWSDGAKAQKKLQKRQKDRLAMLKSFGES